MKKNTQYALRERKEEYREKKKKKRQSPSYDR